MNLSERAVWTSPGLVGLRWAITLVALCLAPVAMSMGGPTAGLVVATLVVPAWIWWSLPFVSLNMNVLNKTLILAVLLFNLVFCVLMVKRLLGA